jgi:DNA-binding NarL/FixJ family response regulator
MDQQRKALIVDNDAARASLVAAALRERGWEPVLTRDATLAFSVALKLKPALIVLRDQVAAGGAPALVERLRRSVHTAGAYIVVVGCEAGRRPDDMLRAGAHACLPGDCVPQAVVDAARQASGHAAPKEAPAEVIAEPQRVQAVHRFLQGGRGDAMLQQLTQLAVALLGTNASMLSLVSEDRQTFLNETPPPAERLRETPLSHSFCQWVVAAREPVLVDDARAHPVLQANGAIDSLGVVAYAGVPISAGEDHTLGSFCTTEPAPRAWTAVDLLVLRSLAKMVEAELVASVPQGLTPGKVFVVMGHGVSAAGSLLRRIGTAHPEAQAVVLRFLERQSHELMVQALGYGAAASAPARQD